MQNAERHLHLEALDGQGFVACTCLSASVVEGVCNLFLALCDCTLFDRFGVPPQERVFHASLARGLSRATQPISHNHPSGSGHDEVCFWSVAVPNEFLQVSQRWDCHLRFPHYSLLPIILGREAELNMIGFRLETPAINSDAADLPSTRSHMTCKKTNVSTSSSKIHQIALVGGNSTNQPSPPRELRRTDLPLYLKPRT